MSNTVIRNSTFIDHQDEAYAQELAIRDEILDDEAITTELNLYGFNVSYYRNRSPRHFLCAMYKLLVKINDSYRLYSDEEIINRFIHKTWLFHFFVCVRLERTRTESRTPASVEEEAMLIDELGALQLHGRPQQRMQQWR